jgi:hypothetical protein
MKLGLAFAWTGQHLPVGVVINVLPALVDDGILIEEKGWPVD